MPSIHVALHVNGERHDLEISPGDTLLAVLRDALGLTGAKEACGRGECGSCTVLVDGVAVLSCVQLACLVRGNVTTVEGLTEECRDLRETFADMGGFQCGFCTSGQVVRAAALLRSDLPTDRTEAERVVRYQISGNICRCTGYNGIVDAILAVAARRRLSADRRKTA
jgi:aerobic-type carbon monoxide dehydrogenase small subunit (CoxS/CutS family)